jgi:hypothetical protein
VLFPSRDAFATICASPGATLHHHFHSIPSCPAHHFTAPQTANRHAFRPATPNSDRLQHGNMGFKRKRAADDSPLSISSFGAVATPESQSPMHFSRGYDGTMAMDAHTTSRPNGWDFASASRVKSSDWGNRTRKRVRDNRPDERAIHGMLS